MKHRCPICEKVIESSEERPGKTASYPFCSRRCKLIDLGAWLDAEYRMPAKPSDEADDQDSD